MNIRQEEEKWLPVKDCENYLISNYGRVKNIRKDKILKPYSGGKGYVTVSLKGKTSYVHRLVGLHFLTGYKRGRCVAHKNFDKRDNFYKNLEWTTFSKLVKYYFKHHPNASNNIAGCKNHFFKGEIRVFKNEKLIDIIYGKKDALNKGYNYNTLINVVSGYRPQPKFTGYKYARVNKL